MMSKWQRFLKLGRWKSLPNAFEKESNLTSYTRYKDPSIPGNRLLCYSIFTKFLWDPAKGWKVLSSCHLLVSTIGEDTLDSQCWCHRRHRSQELDALATIY